MFDAMKKERLVLLTTVSLMSASCAYSLKVHPVEPRTDRPGLYTFYYHPWSKMLDEYGRGEENIRNDSRAVSDSQQKRAIWDQAHAEAELRYLEVNNLIPKECAQGVVIVRSTQYEGGAGRSTFRCK